MNYQGTSPGFGPDVCPVSAIVVTYRSGSYVRECLTALVRELEALNGELIVVDNHSLDETESIVAELMETASVNVRWVARDVNDGFARGCHAGVNVSRGARLLFVNPDVVVQPGAVAQACLVLDDHPRAGIVGGRCVDEQGETDPRSWWGKPTLWSTFCFATGVSSVLPGHRVFDPESPHQWDGQDRRVPIVSGAFVMVERQTWYHLGGFDEDYLLYGEDADLCLRARRKGYEPMVHSGITFQHTVGASSADQPHLRTVLLMRGKATVLRRHLPRGTRDLGVGLLAAGCGLRAALAGSVGPGSRPKTGAAGWATAWRDRRSWMAGWQPGQSLPSPVALVDLAEDKVIDLPNSESNRQEVAK